MTWCWNGRPPITSHHRNCKSYNLERESVALVAALIKALEDWGAEEDGIHPDAWEPYLKAVGFVGDLHKLAQIAKSDEKDK
jgi:hypothetical protein